MHFTLGWHLPFVEESDCFFLHWNIFFLEIWLWLGMSWVKWHSFLVWQTDYLRMKLYSSFSFMQCLMFRTFCKFRWDSRNLTPLNIHLDFRWVFHLIIIWFRDSCFLGFQISTPCSLYFTRSGCNYYCCNFDFCCDCAP